ncbi:hypothetical protein Tsubulata_031645 [Turnera subulata]|uniref:DUF4283 domain-containing protein n=1 Tax=Turnera subulata TaxID=218843 RepID=A0A9Q0FFT9_9ROSI|nr:hypothetical protein Tsubulata_031645 [Turnera subulata]
MSKFRGVRDMRRLLSDVGRVQTDSGQVQENVARGRDEGRSDGWNRATNPQPFRRLPLRKDDESYVEAVKGGSAMVADTAFVPTSDTMAWLARCVVGVLKDPCKMDSAQLIWHLHGFGQVEVSDLGGDSILVCFPTMADRTRFLDDVPEWAHLWFQSLKPWSQGMRATNRRCWLTLRGVPLNAWCHEFFMMIGSVFGSLLQMDPDTASRRYLGEACIQVLTEHGGTVNRALEVMVAGQKCKIDVVESWFTVVKGKHHSSDTTDSDEGGPETPSEAEEVGTKSPEGEDHRERITEESQGDPFSLMPSITKGISRVQSGAEGSEDVSVRREDTNNMAQNFREEDPLTESHQSQRQEGQRFLMTNAETTAPTPHAYQNPVETSNTFGPLAAHEVCESSSPRTATPRATSPAGKRPGPPTIIAAPGKCLATSPSITVSSSESYRGLDESEYIQYLERMLAQAVKTGRVNQRKKFKKLSDEGSLVTASSSTNDDIRRVNLRLHKQASPSATEVSFSEEEARRTMEMGAILAWDGQNDSQHLITLAKDLVETEAFECSKSRANRSCDWLQTQVFEAVATESMDERWCPQIWSPPNLNFMIDGAVELTQEELGHFDVLWSAWVY